jgi:hypothetical protein
MKYFLVSNSFLVNCEGYFSTLNIKLLINLIHPLHIYKHLIG